MLSRLNLTAIVAALALVDLILDRLLTRLFLPPSALAQTGGRALVFAGAFISNLAGALAVLIFASSFVDVIRRRELFPRALRMVASILAACFVVLFAICMSASYPGALRHFVQLRTTAAFLALIISLAMWGTALPVRMKVGISLFMLPPFLHTMALFCGEAGGLRGGPLADQLVRIGELCAFLAAGGAPLLLRGTTRASRPSLAAWLLGALAVAALGVATVLRFDSVKVLALWGLRLELPPLGAPGGWAYLLLFALALFGVVTALVPALRAGGPDRLFGYGLIMVVTSGYQIGTPADLAVAMAGLFAIALGVLRRSAGDLPGEAEAAPVAA